MSPSDDPKTSVVELKPGGYGRPPEEHRFKKGRSGNPRGRPRKHKPKPLDPIMDGYLGDMILFEAMRPVQIRENDRIVELPMIQAVLRSLSVSALKGSHRAQVAITTMVKTVQDKTIDNRTAVYQAATAYKKEWRERFADCDRRGVPRPEAMPHPDEILIDERTLEVRMNGPESHDEKAQWDQMLLRKAQFKEELDELRAELKSKRKRSPDYAKFIEDEIAYADYIYRIIDQTVPDEKTRREPGFDITKWRASKLDKTLKRPKVRR